MPNINDIRELRPELLDKSPAELDRMMTEIQMAKTEKERSQREEERKKNFEEAKELHNEFLRVVSRMHSIGYLYDRIEKVLTTSEGNFTPGRFLKAPRSMKD